MTIIKTMDKYISLIDVDLKDILKKNSIDETIYNAMEYSLHTGGKRLRPLMAIKSFELFNSDIDKVLPFALAIEMIHTYSLIHDDLPCMDNDDFRRGKPTNHKVYGEAMAILAGDGLLNLAFETMATCTKSNSSSLEDYKRYVRAMEEVGQYSGCNGMIGGQVLDLMSSSENMSEEKLIYMYRSKTAALIQASLASGAIIGGANEEEIQILKDFGLYLGLAYQIKDDILDENQDDYINKFTYLKYYSKKEAEEQVSILSEKALKSIESLNNKDTSFFKSLTNYLINRDI